jgi:chromosome partitioning protein
MILTIASFKGGVGKTTTAVHLAAYLQQSAPTLLVDGDLNRSALEWAEPGLLPFAVVAEQESANYIPNYRHIVIDTPARPSSEELHFLADNSDLLIIPTTPAALSISALQKTIGTLTEVGSGRYRILLTMVPTNRTSVAADARVLLEDAGLPLFKTDIRHYVAHEYAPLQGRTVRDLDYANADKAWQDYEVIGKELDP